MISTGTESDDLEMETTLLRDVAPRLSSVGICDQSIFNCAFFFSFSPCDTKFVTCSDDATVRIWDFFRCHEERALRGEWAGGSFFLLQDSSHKFLVCFNYHVPPTACLGHGSDVRSIAWHPYKSLIISGSKDAQQPIKLWEPKTGESIATL